MPTASEVIAYERSFVGKASYVNDTHGPNTFDCVGLQDWCLNHFGLLEHGFIPDTTWPQTVYYFYSHFTGTKVPAGGAITPGDLIIMGNPNASDYHEMYSHIGMVSDKLGYYISAYDPAHGITEYPIPTFSTFKVIWILKTNLGDSMIPVKGTATIISGDVARLIQSDGALVKPKTNTLQVFGFTPSGVNVYNELAWMVMQDGLPYWLLAHDCTVVLS